MRADPSLDEIIACMKRCGVARVYAKRLSQNDNAKNQFYVGGDFAVLNVLPASKPEPTTSGKHQTPIFRATVQFEWLAEDGALFAAPGAKLILYPQYPEVRLSGLSRGAQWAPADVVGSVRSIGRVLLLGVRDDRTVVGYGAWAGSRVAKEVLEIRPRDDELLVRVPLARGSDDSALLAALCRVTSKGWIPAARLAGDGHRVPCGGPNCAGYTLEAELGVRPNGRAAPDFEGWEVKSHLVPRLDSSHGGRLTLMTPEPTGGVYREEGVEAFVRRFGYADTRGREKRFNFGGIHRVGVKSSRTGLTMVFQGVDIGSGKLERSDAVLALTDGETVAAAWSVADLLGHWGRKHSLAAFVPAEKSAGAAVEYRYGSTVHLGRGADFLRLVRAFALGRVYYDPGIKLELASGKAEIKRRSQFRTDFSDLPTLYRSWERRSVCA
jgi:hypothetical protein